MHWSWFSGTRFATRNFGRRWWSISPVCIGFWCERDLCWRRLPANSRVSHPAPDWLPDSASDPPLPAFCSKKDPSETPSNWQIMICFSVGFHFVRRFLRIEATTYDLKELFFLSHVEIVMLPIRYSILPWIHSIPFLTQSRCRQHHVLLCILLSSSEGKELVSTSRRPRPGTIGGVTAASSNWSERKKTKINRISTTG